MKTFTVTLDEAQVSLVERMADSGGLDVPIGVIVQAIVDNSLQMGAMLLTNPDLFNGLRFRDTAIAQGNKLLRRLRDENA